MDARTHLERVRSGRLSKRDMLVLGGIGYGFNMALVTLVGWPGSASIFSSGLCEAGELSPFMLAKNLAFCLAFFAWFALALAGGPRFYRSFSKAATNWAFSAMIALGAVLTLLTDGKPALGVDLASGILLGIGVSGNFTLWQRCLCFRPAPIDAQALMGGTIIGGLLHFALAWIPHDVVAIAGALILPAITSLLLSACSHGIDETPLFPESRRERVANLRTGALSLMAPCVTIMAFGMIMQVLRLTLPGEQESLRLGNNLMAFAMMGATALLFVRFENTRYRLNMNLFYQVFAPLIALALIGLPLLGAPYQYAMTAALYGVFAVASVMGILACSQAARYYRVPPIAIYALFFGIIYTGRYIPALALHVPALSGAGPLVGPGAIAFGGIALLFAVYVGNDRLVSGRQSTQRFVWEPDLSAEERYVVALSLESVEAVAQRNHLTNREREILGKLRAGRSLPYIAEELCVAENTVKYHCKNIYAKLGVHSRQELFDLLDGKREADPSSSGGDARRGRMGKRATASEG